LVRACLPAVTGVDVARVARAYAAAVPRVLGEVRWRYVVTDLAVVVQVVYLSRGAVRLVGSVPAASPSWAVLVAAATYGLVLAAGAVVSVRSVLAQRPDPHAVDLTVDTARSPVRTLTTTRFLHGLFAMTVVITAVITPVDEVEALSFGLGFDAFRRAAGFSSTLVMLSAVLALAELCVLFLRFGAEEKRSGRPSSLDGVATRLVVVAAGVWRCSDRAGEVGDREVRSLVAALESAAREAQRCFRLGVPWRDRATRRAAGADGARLAAVLRAHKAPLMRALGPADFAAVARSLTGGLDARARGDLATMLRTAPEVTAPRGPWPWLRRLGPAAVLAVLGIVLPLLPPLREVAPAAAAARTSLLVGALMAVVTGGVRVPEYVQKVLGKAAPGT
jgi:hypothetical protein